MEILAVYPWEPEIPVRAQMPPLGMLWVVGEVGRLWRGLLRGLGFKVKREEDRVRDVPLVDMGRSKRTI